MSSIETVFGILPVEHLLGCFFHPEKLYFEKNAYYSGAGWGQLSGMMNGDCRVFEIAIDSAQNMAKEVFKSELHYLLDAVTLLDDDYFKKLYKDYTKTKSESTLNLMFQEAFVISQMQSYQHQWTKNIPEEFHRTVSFLHQPDPRQRKKWWWQKQSPQGTIRSDVLHMHTIFLNLLFDENSEQLSIR